MDEHENAKLPLQLLLAVTGREISNGPIVKCENEEEKKTGFQRQEGESKEKKGVEPHTENWFQDRYFTTQVLVHTLFTLD
jgi:hypothetical protein